MVASPVPPARAAAKPRHRSADAALARLQRRCGVAQRLSARWAKQTRPKMPANIYELPLSDLLLYGLTHDADEGPGLDVLGGVVATVEGWIYPDAHEEVTSVSVVELMMLVRRIEVAMELVRRGAGAFEEAPLERPAAP